MKLATLRDGTRDGALIVVASDASRCMAVGQVAPTMQAALEEWSRIAPALRQCAAQVEAGAGVPFDARMLAAPLPRAWQWLDGSAFDAHGRLMTRLFGIQPKRSGRPLMYQGLSHAFLGPWDDVPLPRESDDIDFEGEFAVVTDAVPMGASPEMAAAHIRLVMLINDWSLRTLARDEMQTGFGWIQAKPACSAAPFAVTPDALGPGWAHNRVQMRLRVDLNGTTFGEPHGGEMTVSFSDLIAHAAATRSLCAGTIIGSGTVSNDDYASTGSTCIAERRAIETLDGGAPSTAFLRFGDRVRMSAVDDAGRSPFGMIDQRVVKAHLPRTDGPVEAL